MKNEEIVLQQRNFNETDYVSYRVVKLVNRLEPHIGEELTKNQMRRMLVTTYDHVTITILPLDEGK